MKKKAAVSQNESIKVEERFVSRKQFLMGAGAAVALPPLLSMMPKAVAQTTTSEKKLRLCMLAQEYGMYTDDLVPSSSALSGKLTSLSSYNGKTIPTISYAELKNLADPISYVIDANLGDLKTDINIINGLDLMSMAGHNFGIFSGSSGGRELNHGRSIDAIISESAAFKKSFRGSYPVYRNTNYGFAEGFWYDRKRDANGNFLNGEENCVNFRRTVSDAKMFNDLFGSLTSNTTVTSPELTRKKLLIDLVKSDYSTLKSHKRLSSSDRYLLDQYAEGLFQIESNLQISTQSCGVPTTKPSFQSLNGDKPIDIEIYWKNVAQMMLLAFQCDISRIYCAHYFKAEFHHQIDDSEAEYWGSKWQRDWIHTMSRHLVRGMKNTKDPFGNGESLLEKSLVIWTNEHSNRPVHSHANIPLITFGQLGNKVRSGYYMDFQQIKNRYKPYENRGYPAKMLMVSVMEAMGVTRSEILREGDSKGFGSWPSGAFGGVMTKATMADLYNLNYFEAGTGTLNGPTHSSALPFFTKL